MTIGTDRSKSATGSTVGEVAKNPVTPISSCCAHAQSNAAGDTPRIDWLLWGSASVIVIGYVAGFFLTHSAPMQIGVFAHSIQDMLHIMWWGILVGMVAVGLIDRVPRRFVIGLIGREQGARSLLRAIGAGVFLDLCNHGVLMVGIKLYERGASLGQVFAFLIASPWNSLSLTLIIGVLMGWGWMLVFVVGSILIAFVTGMIVEALERAGRVPANVNRIDIPDDFEFWKEARSGLSTTRYDLAFVRDVARRSVTASRMVLRWLFFGIVLAALVQSFVPTDVFASLFGATLAGLFMTLIAATLIEVCSEGSVPLGADLMSRAQAPGNAFTFLMAGASTDYTEILLLREVTQRLRSALLLPLLTVPQVVLIGWLLNSAV